MSKKAKKPEQQPVADGPVTSFDPAFPVDRIERSTYNPRLIEEEGWRQLSHSLDRFGMVQNLVLNARDDGTFRLIAGHQRLEILSKRGSTTVPVSIVRVSDADEKSLNLHMNGHAGRFDRDRLKDILQELHENGEDLNLLELDNDSDFQSTMAELESSFDTDADREVRDQRQKREDARDERDKHTDRRPGDGTGLYQISFPLDVSFRHRYLKLVAAAKRKTGCEQVPDAIAAACAAFLE